MNIAELLAKDPIEVSDEPAHEDTELEGLESNDDEDDLNAIGEEAAVAEILDAFHSKDTNALRTALKSFIQLCRD